MKLINKTQMYYLPLIIGLVVIWCGGFLWYIAQEMDQSIDDALENELEAAVHELQTDETPPDLLAETLIFSIRPIAELSDDEEAFKDTLLTDPEDDEAEPFRQVSTQVMIKGNPYRVTLRKSQLEYEDMFSTILIALLVFVVLLIASIIIINRKFLQRIWDPFYATLGRFSSYQVEKGGEVQLAHSDIEEFQKLNDGVRRLLARVEADYERLKQFTENASHEIQTPLSVIQNQVELLFQDTTLTETQRERLGAINKMSGRLSRLNSALLLLTKIDNNQYAQQDPVNISALISQLVLQYRDLARSKNITIGTDIAPDVVKEINPDLAEMLFRNVFSNAMKHNHPNGIVSVYLNEAHFVISNTGPEPAGNPARFFDRFRKDDSDSESLGLGLSLVQTIAIASNFDVNYVYRDEKHWLTIRFNS